VDRSERSRSGTLTGALAWGAAWAIVGSLVLSRIAPSPWPLQPSRAKDLRASLTVLEHGGPALLGYRSGSHLPYPIGYSDDQGIYVIVPVLSDWLGASDPIAVLRWLWVAAWAVALLFSAIVSRSLFRSSWATRLAPPMLLVCALSFGFGDLYWVSAWVIVTLLPLLVWLARDRPRHLWAALVMIALIAGVATTIRSAAGLPVVLSAAAVAITAAGKRWPIRAGVLLVLAAAYLAPAWLALPAIREHRDHLVGVDLSAQEPTSHPLWHTVYIGLGYTSNRYDIHYLDGYAAAAAQQADPGVRYLSPAYASVLHRQVSALVDHDPGFVAKAEGEKALVVLSHSGRYLLLLALLLPGALAARARSRLRPFELMLFLPALAIGALPAILAAPFRDYELTLLAPLGTLGLLTIGSAAARGQRAWISTRAAPEGLRGRGRLALSTLSSTWPIRLTAGVLLCMVLLLAPVYLLARHLEAEHERWDLRIRNPPTVRLIATAKDPRAVLW
jgi:hypothetical protein